MTSLHLSLPGPSIVCGFAISIPVAAAIIAFAWRQWRRSRNEDRPE